MRPRTEHISFDSLVIKIEDKRYKKASTLGQNRRRIHRFAVFSHFESEYRLTTGALTHQGYLLSLFYIIALPDE